MKSVLLFVAIITISCSKNQVKESMQLNNESPTLCECKENMWDIEGKYDQTLARAAGTLIPRSKLANKYNSPVWYVNLTDEDKKIRDKCNKKYVETELLQPCN